ncbi:MAG TPA: glycosyltransferase [Candidatus Limnocylindria bacterium]
MAAHPQEDGAVPRRPRLLFYAMYDARRASNAPRVRIQLLSQALTRHAAVHMVSGSRLRRLTAASRAALTGSLWRADAVYVETITSSAMPWDLLFLAAARATGKPVGIYFRDAYQLFRDLYPIPGWRARLSDLAWRASVWALRRLATVCFVPSAGLASALHLRRAVLLPPGTDPATPDLGAGDEPLVAYVGALTAADGFDRLLEAMHLVREQVTDARLLAIGPAVPGGKTTLPEWVEVRRASRDELAPLLAPARVCVIPRPINPYTDLAWPIKLSDYLAFGKPVVATATAETVAVLDGTGAGLVVGDSVPELANGLARVLSDSRLAAALATQGRALALDEGMTWDHRARHLLNSLGLGERRAG